MRNLKAYNENCFKIYQTAINRKRDNQLQKRLQTIEHNITTAYDLYSEKFEENNIEIIPVDNFFKSHLEDLQSLYKFDSFIIRKVKKTIDDLQLFPLGNTCQNCTINSVNSMDHILAKVNYPEYSVHPFNLFPSCTECNGYKGVSFRKNGYRRFLNLYSDKLPDQQYLFAHVFVDEKGMLDWKFIIEDRSGIEINIFNIIKNHFDELHLCSRMKLSSIKYYSEFRNTVKARLSDLSWEKIIVQIKKEVFENMQNLGSNHYQYILQLAMIENDLFKDSFAT